MVFMDEMGVDIDHSNDIYWIKPGQKRPVQYRYPQKVKVNIWGAIWYNGRTSLHFTKKTFDSNHYIHVLQGHLHPHLPLRRKEFIHDGVPWHWTHAVQNWCDNERVSLVQDFPALSPDLNAIEYVWAYVKHKVRAAHPTDYQSLKDAIRSAWERLSQDMIRHYINHMETVMQSIVASKGWDSI
jgi:hypothetical protein